MYLEEPMSVKLNLFGRLLAALILFSLSACSALLPAEPTATPTALPTNTPLPPTETPVPPTNTPLPPTPTFTEAPTATPAESPTPLPSPTPGLPTATPTEKDAILVYYISKDNAGRFGCNEQLFWLNTGIARSGDIALDIKTALQRLFSYRSETIGSLYNAGYSANFSVSGVEVNGGTANIALSGDYTRTKDKCDPRRLIDQIKQTAKQFPTVGQVVVTLNGHPIADALSRK